LELLESKDIARLLKNSTHAHFVAMELKNSIKRMVSYAKKVVNLCRM